ncbi:hypothetical protein W97_04183 [Coniosporium apollinis CBS 100218]|uniref:Uncharacterized protein n=1 Tax=Coniosporium apollinis (strain CBS 100218) TaxID=1168221 RepID=R7YSY3_CONA1|nr:uncharacterized protein W97_04183 [Coniosporium apollinis CBS 100218]EON64948.1 hypothetical protein W97_04183 [Coniosporium apollinis CBS 100218]
MAPTRPASGSRPGLQLQRKKNERISKRRTVELTEGRVIQLSIDAEAIVVPMSSYASKQDCMVDLRDQLRSARFRLPAHLDKKDSKAYRAIARQLATRFIDESGTVSILSANGELTGQTPSSKQQANSTDPETPVDSGSSLGGQGNFTGGTTSYRQGMLPSAVSHPRCPNLKNLTDTDGCGAAENTPFLMAGPAPATTTSPIPQMADTHPVSSAARVERLLSSAAGGIHGVNDPYSSPPDKIPEPVDDQGVPTSVQGSYGANGDGSAERLSAPSHEGVQPSAARSVSHLIRGTEFRYTEGHVTMYLRNKLYLSARRTDHWIHANRLVTTSIELGTSQSRLVGRSRRREMQKIVSDGEHDGSARFVYVPLERARELGEAWGLGPESKQFFDTMARANLTGGHHRRTTAMPLPDA